MHYVALQVTCMCCAVTVTRMCSALLSAERGGVVSVCRLVTQVASPGCAPDRANFMLPSRSHSWHTLCRRFNRSEQRILTPRLATTLLPPCLAARGIRGCLQHTRVAHQNCKVPAVHAALAKGLSKGGNICTLALPFHSPLTHC